MGLSVNLKTFGKYLDQPALINQINNKVPIALSIAGASYVAYNTIKEPSENRKNKFIQDASVITFTIGSALLAGRGLVTSKGKKIFEGLIELPHLHTKDIDEVLAKNPDEKTKKLIEKVRNNEKLKFKEVKALITKLDDFLPDLKSPISKIIPDSHSHGPFEELGKLSVVGLVPVLGGILGGVVGDLLTKDNWKKKFPDKVKEGSYQYLNNIFLCNVGAGIAMLAMNKMKVKSKPIRFAAMLGGVVAVGLIAGSAIANYIGKKLINPLFGKKEDIKPKNTPKPDDFTSLMKDLNSERHPEALDLSLHIDDIASVGFLSGFKWIGPILPALYLVSGYRAGIGYRNGGEELKA